ncbi:histidine kinase [Nonomuraea sp. NPDC001636]|uniref:sensor histidine kinase n=1 Tax=Nonomuraea sp. NPDC001636 TaxID=3154391 RepID=UPI003325C7A8
MVSEHTQRGGRLRRSFAALSRLSRVGDVPVVVMLAWAGWLAVPWSFSGLAQARAAAAAAAADAEPPPSSHASDTASPPSALAPHSKSPSAFASHTASPSGLASHTASPSGLASHTASPSAFVPGASVAGGGGLCGLGAGGAASGRGAWPVGAAWGIPAPAVAHPAATVRPARPTATADAFATATPHAPNAVPHTPETVRHTAGGVAHTAEAVAHTAEAVPHAADTVFGQAEAVLGRSGAFLGKAEVAAAERARIAGEVHDAAGHGLAAIAMQAGLALVVLDDDPEQARASLRAIRETSTTALAHLRAALDGIDPPAADLPGLIAGVRAAGLPVDVEPADLADPAVPAHLRDAVYRVVRESLTNVLRHAGPTRASVRLADGPCVFVLEVADRGAGWNGAAEGRGLAGMRAHVTGAGGRLTAGPREGGGFQVTARFPRYEA